MTKILVTGATGFIGYHLLKALSLREDRATCLIRKTSDIQQLESFRPDWAHGDVGDLESLRGAVAGKSTVYHLAGCIKALDSRQLQRVNSEGVRNIAQACAEQPNPPVLVIISSLAAAGPSTADRPRLESDTPAPVSRYGRSKLAGEGAARQFADRVPITILRPPIVVGERDRVTLELFRSIQRFGTHLVVSWRTHRYSVIHAEDLAQATLQAAERGKRLAVVKDDEPAGSEGIYFTAGSEHPTYAELGRLVGKTVGRRRLLVIPVALPVAWSVAGCTELGSRIRGQPAFFNWDKMREAGAGSWTCSNEKAAREIGFQVAAPLKERLGQTAEWYRREGWL